MSAIPFRTQSPSSTVVNATTTPSQQQQQLALHPQPAGELARRRSSGPSAPRTAFDRLAQPPSLQTLPPELLEKILVYGELNLEDVSRLFHTSRNCAGLVKAAMSANACVLTASRSLSSQAGELPTIKWFDGFAKAYDSRTGIRDVQAFHAPMLDQDGNRLSAPDGSLRAVSQQEHLLTRLIEAATQWRTQLHPYVGLPDERRRSGIQVMNRVLDSLPSWIAFLPVDAIAPLTVSAMNLTLDAHEYIGDHLRGNWSIGEEVSREEIDKFLYKRMETLWNTAESALKNSPHWNSGRATMALHTAGSDLGQQAEALDAFDKYFHDAKEFGNAEWLLTASNAAPRLNHSNYQRLFSICNNMVLLMESSALKSAPPRLFDGLTRVIDDSLDDTAFSTLTDLLSKLPEGAPATIHLAEEVPHLLVTKSVRLGGATAERLLELSLDRTPDSTSTGPDAGARLEQQLATLANLLQYGEVERESALFSKGVHRFLSLARRSTSSDAAIHAADLAAIDIDSRQVVDPVLMTGALEAIERYAHQLRPGEAAATIVLAKLRLLTQPDSISPMDTATKLKAGTVIDAILKRRLGISRRNWLWDSLQNNLQSLSGDEPALR